MRRHTCTVHCWNCKKVAVFEAGRFGWAVKAAERVGWRFYDNLADPDNVVWRCPECVKARKPSKPNEEVKA